jgi:hypothetical protein
MKEMSNYEIESQSATVNGQRGNIVTLYSRAEGAVVYQGKYFVPAKYRSKAARTERAIDLMQEENEKAAHDALN